MKPRKTYQQKHIQSLIQENRTLKRENSRLREALDSQTQMLSEMRDTIKTSQQKMHSSIQELNHYKQEYQALVRDMRQLKSDYSNKTEVLLSDLTAITKRSVKHESS